MIKPYHVTSEAIRAHMIEQLKHLPLSFKVLVGEIDNRTLEQNSAQWPILEAISEQMKWPVNGELVKITPEEFKDILTAAFYNETVRLAQGWNGGVVMLGKRTSKFGKKKFSEWLEFLHAAAAERGVVVYPDQRESA